MKRVGTILTVAALVALAGCGGAGSGGVDGGGVGDGAGVGGDGANAPPAAQGAAEDRVGVSAGGAQDANAFRENVREGYVPQPTDLTYEGLFHDYYFDTDEKRPCEARFCPSYTTAVTRDPLSNETERFVSVGLNSGLTEGDIGARPLNLVVVVDTSSSMSDRFDDYYYDGDEKKTVEESTRKIEAARESVVAMLDHLDAEDRVSVVSYDNDASVVQGLRRVSELDRADLRSSVRGLSASGGTNLDAGMRAAHRQVAEVAGDSGRETRVVYVTDAMPNLGETDGDSLESRMRDYASEGIHTTFVGVGVDFNSRLTEQISTVRGANYYSVHSPEAFAERMDEGFAYMTSPLAYNLSLRVQGSGYEVEAVYGSPQADAASEELMHVSTLFPSRREENKSEGGVVLLELERTGTDPRLELTASYESPGGQGREVGRNVTLEDRDPPYYGSSGVRKAVALSEYATLLRNWMAHERALASGGEGELVDANASVEHRALDSQWEQTSVALTVSDPYDDRIERFREYFRDQREALDTDRMERDLEILDRLAAVGNGTNASASPESVPDEPGTAGETGPTPTAGGGSDAAALPVGLFGGGLPSLGLVNLAVTVTLAGYGIRQKRRSRDRQGGDR